MGETAPLHLTWPPRGPAPSRPPNHASLVTHSHGATASRQHTPQHAAARSDALRCQPCAPRAVATYHLPTAPYCRHLPPAYCRLPPTARHLPTAATAAPCPPLPPAAPYCQPLMKSGSPSSSASLRLYLRPRGVCGGGGRGSHSQVCVGGGGRRGWQAPSSEAASPVGPYHPDHSTVAGIANFAPCRRCPLRTRPPLPRPPWAPAAFAPQAQSSVKPARGEASLADKRRGQHAVAMPHSPSPQPPHPVTWPTGRPCPHRNAHRPHAPNPHAPYPITQCPTRPHYGTHGS